MKSRGIIYSTEMVRAKLEGRKTQTRRIVKFPDYWTGFEDSVIKTSPDMWPKCPYGKVGDLLYVKEAFIDWASDGNGWPPYRYKATESGFFKWKSPIFMPKSAARIIDEITEIRVERVQDISVEDCKAEGLIAPVEYQEYPPFGITESHLDHELPSEYKSLWIKINGPAYVWPVVSFLIHQYARNVHSSPT